MDAAYYPRPCGAKLYLLKFRFLFFCYLLYECVAVCLVRYNVLLLHVSVLRKNFTKASFFCQQLSFKARESVDIKYLLD